MKILYFTDPHGTMQKPEGRLDDYPTTYLKKLTELKFACKHFNVDMVICGGDLFHIPRVSDRFAGLTAEIIKEFPPTFVVPGNHDIEGYNISTLSTTKLGLLEKTGVIQLLTRQNPIFITDKSGISVAISGQEYYANIDKGNPNDFMMLNPSSNKADINILVAHAYVTPDPQHPDITCTLIKDITTDADIILSGHYHREFEVEREDGVSFYNPGSALRVAQTDYNKTHMPKYAILDISLDNNDIVYDYQAIPFMVAQPGTDIFDYTQQAVKKATVTTLTGFKNSLVQSSNQTLATPSMAIQDIVRAICAKPEILSNYGPDIEKKVSASINDALINDSGNLSLPSGYVVANKKKHLKRIEIHHFEAHKDTVIDLCDGLNIFGGPSGGGKSSIFRAVLWVTDNEPAGTNFIMTGYTECWVKLTYSDGTYIKRSRTDKNSGEYEIGYADLNGNPIIDPATGKQKVDILKGFGQSVPLEVMNAHQMPKVYLTKDLSVHLNVTNQIDSAFLINESPQQKASAIGRITGTHIIDAAIQAENKKVLANSKSIKQYTSDIDEWKKALSNMPNITAMEQAANDLKQQKTTLDNLLQSVKEYQDFIDRSNNNTQEIENHKTELAQKEILVVKKNELEQKSKEVTKEIELLLEMQKNNFERLKVSMESERLRFEKSKREEIVKHKKSFEKIPKLFASLEDMKRFYDSFDKTKNDLTKMQEEFNTKSFPANTGSLLKNALTEINLCLDYYKSYRRSDSINAMIVDMDNELEITIDKAADIKEEIKIIESSLSKEIVEQCDICPCCGTVVTDERMAEHLLESYKKGVWKL